MRTETARAERLMLPLAVAVTALVHLGALRDGFVFDDHLAIDRNTFVRGESPWREVLVRDWFGFHRDQSVGIGTWRPLVTLTFRLNWWMGHGAPWVFHLTNVALHALITFALGWSYRRATGNARDAALVALLFGVHTLHAEAVVSLVGRAELMLTLFALGAGLAHASLRRGASAVVVACVACALLCKESAVLLVGILFLLDALLRRDAWRQLWPRYAGMTVALVASAVARRAALGSLQGYQISAAINPLIHAPWHVQKLNAVRLLGHAVTLLLLPLNLLPDYGLRVMLPSMALDGALALGAATAIGCVVFLWRYARAPGAQPEGALIVASTTVFAVFGAFATNMVIVLPALFAERFWYLPSAAFLFVVVNRASALRQPALRRAALVGMLAWAALLCALTVRRTAEWRTDASLAAACVEVNPRCGLCVLNLGLERLDDGRLREAYSLCRAASDLRPEIAASWGCVGTVLARMGRIDDAIHAYELMAQRPSAPLEFEGNYARALLLAHRPQDALRQLQRTAQSGRWDARAEAIRVEAAASLRAATNAPTR